MCPLNLKLLKIFLYGLSLAGTTQWLHANELDIPQCLVQCQAQCAVSRLQIGASYAHASIEVGADGKAFHGHLGGIQGIYEYKPWNSLYAGLKVDWKQGKTHDPFADRKIIYVNAEERVGYTFASSCNWSATLFSGLGFRYMQHKFARFLFESTKPALELKYNTFYIPVGILSEYCFCPYWSIGLNVTWMPQIYPTVEIAPLKGAHWSLKKKIGNVLVELPLTYAFTQNNCMALSLKPFYERWEDGRSIAKTSGGEKLGLPKHPYHFWGVVLSFLSTF